MTEHDMIIAMLLREFTEQYVSIKVGIGPEEVQQNPDECSKAIKDVFKRVFAKMRSTNITEITGDIGNLAKFLDCIGNLMDEAANEFLAEQGIKVQ